jgi:hypothetical protein
MTDYEKFALAVACPYCTARPAQRCRTASGARAPMHTARSEPFRLAWLAGYEKAEAEKPTPTGYRSTCSSHAPEPVRS